MDILFSAYGSGSLPQSAMEEVERRTEELLRSGTFSHLEKKSKLDLQATYPPSVPYSATSSGSLPSLILPSGSSSSKEHSNPMRSPATRSVTLQSLSLSIPQSPESHSPLPGTGDEDSGSETPTNPRSPHKQVKFLAPGIDDEGMSDQSSICQSPSWENYGQRKKEKKLEAERRKKEKLQAEKEAKASKKRNASRLSKLPPPTAAAGTGFRTSAIFSPERSMSDPSLITQHSLLHPQPIARPEAGSKAASTDNLQQSRRYLPAGNEVLKGDHRPRPYIASQGAISNNHSDPRLDLPKSLSEGPAPDVPTIPSLYSPNNDGRLSRDACPPSASRTPMLRHMSPSGHTRSNSLPQKTTSHLRGRDGHRSSDRRPDNYVQHQRAQNNELTLAGLVDEGSFANANTHSSSRSSSCNPRHSRRSSFTQDAKAAAMKLIGRRGTSATRIETVVGDRSSSIQGDYFSTPNHPHALISSPVEVQGSTISKPPSTSHSTGSSGGFSVADSASASHTKRSRSLKDAAKAAFNISKRPQLQTSATAPSAAPPYFSFRDRKQSKGSGATGTGGTRVLDDSSKIHSTNPVNQPAAPSSVSSHGTTSQTGSQVSEGSSNCSTFEDGSSLVSPTITPDTSRPQSSGAGSAVEDTSANKTPSSPQTENVQSPRSSKSTTPRPEKTDECELQPVGGGDSWSRTAMPLDDIDAQSFITSRSNFDDSDETSPISPAYTDLPAAPEEPTISIPPRSQKRTLSISNAGGPSYSTERTAERSPTQYVAKEDIATKPLRPERANRKQKRDLRTREFDNSQRFEAHEIEPYSEALSSNSSTHLASPPLPPKSGTRGNKPVMAEEYEIPSSPYSEDFPGHDTFFTHGTRLAQVNAARPPSQPRTHPAPLMSPAFPLMPRASTPSALTSPGAHHAGSMARPGPISILKPPKHSDASLSAPTSPGQAPVLSSLPRHMQPKPGPSSRTSSSVAESRAAPIAKMFVECCSCKFYHDMPSKIYECMAKPDAVVEDRNLGISGAITTAVKCPWCQHSMSTGCCAGYAAVVYLKEKLH
ncbi:hypothetical protein QBC40DRAFT_190198 [Triangularia verruculosa]|uniref:Uncharacterized protein n=1 Tax=Triangularia verruculosa TaxID=2587418 RepID=A0AAN7B004_9PEZI|nr:hypothetical protein QBC40DRAFT_190198 [Triangularia verruculosa]